MLLHVSFRRSGSSVFILRTIPITVLPDIIQQLEKVKASNIVARKARYSLFYWQLLAFNSLFIRLLELYCAHWNAAWRPWMREEMKRQSEIVPAYKMYNSALRDSRKKREPKSLGKPSKHVYARSITNLGARPKIVTGSMFPKAGIRKTGKKGSHKITVYQDGIPMVI